MSAAPPTVASAKAEVDIVPEDRRVGRVVDEEAGRVDGVAVPLHNLHAGAVSDPRQCIGELADAAADRRHHAALAKLTADDISAARGRPTRGAPEAERFAGLEDDAIDGRGRNSQVLNLAELELALPSIGLGVDRMLIAGERYGALGDGGASSIAPRKFTAR